MKTVSVREAKAQLSALIHDLDDDVVHAPAERFRLPGKGMPHVRNGRRGDQYVRVQVLVPKDLTPEQKSLLRKVGGLTGKPEKVSRGFFEKLRDAISLD